MYDQRSQPEVDRLTDARGLPNHRSRLVAHQGSSGNAEIPRDRAAAYAAAKAETAWPCSGQRISGTMRPTGCADSWNTSTRNFQRERATSPGREPNTRLMKYRHWSTINAIQGLAQCCWGMTSGQRGSTGDKRA